MQHLLIKKGNRSGTMGQLACYLICRKFLKGVFITEYLNLLTKYFLNTNCGFRKDHRTQYSLIVLNKWKQSVDQGHVFGTLLTNLLKAFDWLPRNLIPKLNADAFDNKGVRFVYDYLTSRNSPVNKAWNRD